MARLTRSESQARTRQQLVTTAQEMFLADGYASTSLDKVAEAAGYSKGAVYSNFRNKDELCLAVLDAIHETQARRMAAALESARTMDQLLDGVLNWAEENVGEQAWTALEVEFATNVRHNERVRDELAVRDRQIRESLAGLLGDHADRLGITLPLSAADCATALLSLGIGLGVQRAVDPDIPMRLLPDMLRLLTGDTNTGRSFG